MTNEKIAIDVMGWEVMKGSNWYRMPDGKVTGLDFLNDHNDAMMVVEKLNESGMFLKVGQGKKGFTVYFFDSPFNCVSEAQHESLCHAICEAALKAKGETP